MFSKVGYTHPGRCTQPQIIHQSVGKNLGLQLNFHHSLLYFNFSICMSYDGRRVLVQCGIDVSN